MFLVSLAAAAPLPPAIAERDWIGEGDGGAYATVWRRARGGWERVATVRHPPATAVNPG